MLGWLSRLMGREQPTKNSSPGRPSARPPLRLEQLEDRSAAALLVTPASAAALVQSLIGAGVAVSNIQYTGAAVASGAFTGGNGIIGFNSGIVLSSGLAADVVGPNTGGTSTNNGQPGDAQLTALAGTSTFDAAVLEFDFVPRSRTLTFNYVFGSDEYPNFAPPISSGFNDVFAYFLNGQNVALLPGTTTAVAINSVNPVTNSQFFVDNTGGAFDTQMNGFTTVLSVTAAVNRGQVNHIRIAIADATDAIVDSWVLLQSGSFNSVEYFFKTYHPLRYDFDAQSHTYKGNVTLLNVDPDGLPADGPLRVVFPSLPAGVTLVNPSGFDAAGSPFIAINANSVPANTSIRVPIEFSNPGDVPMSTFFLDFPINVVRG